MPVEWLDIILILVVLVSAVLAMIRGFSREMFSILSWIGAIVAGVLGYPKGAEVIGSVIPDLTTYPQLPSWIAGIGIFFIVLIVLSYITSFFADRIIDSRIGALDRTLGFIFGALRGIVLMSVTLTGFLWMANANVPTWIDNAKAKPALIKIAEVINNTLPQDMEKVILKVLSARSDNATDDTTEQ